MSQLHSLYLPLILFSLLALCPQRTFGTLPPNLKNEEFRVSGRLWWNHLLFYSIRSPLPALNSNRKAECMNMLIFWSSLNPQLSSSCRIGQSWFVGFHNSPGTTQIGMRMKRLTDRSGFWFLLSHKKRRVKKLDQILKMLVNLVLGFEIEATLDFFSNNTWLSLIISW